MPVTPETLQKVRQILNKSQSELADLMGYKTKQSIWLKERGQQDITARDEKILQNLIEKHLEQRKQDDKFLQNIIQTETLPK